MRIIEQYNSDNPIYAVVRAEYLQDYTLRIYFDDGKISEVDFAPFLKQSRHPAIKKYLDLELFKSYEIVSGDLNWNDFDLIFPVSDLYEGEIK